MSNTEKPFQPDFLSYQKSLGDELKAVKDRVRHLIQHWATDGAFKEAALRSIFRRYLPESLLVGTGFVVSCEECSTQVDILIVDRKAPTLFKDGDLMIVTPDVVRGVIEVKTTLGGSKDIAQACEKLCNVTAMCSQPGNIDKRLLWSGLFVYDGALNQERNLLSAVYNAFQQTRCDIKCIAYGSNTLIQCSETNQVALNGVEANGWTSWYVPGMAPSYFIGQMLNLWFKLTTYSEPVAWFPEHSENRPTF